MRWHPGEEGASEVVGVMLLVGLTVFAVAVVAAIFLASPQPGKIPHVAILAGNESVAGIENRRLVLAHEGGDPLRTGEYRIYIDTGSGLTERTSDFSEPEGGIWSIGESINYTGTETLRRVVVTVLSGGSETILSEPAFVGGGAKFSPDPVEPGNTNGDDEPEESFIDFVINENVFVYGNVSQFSNGNHIDGQGATIIITGDVKENDLKSVTTLSVSKIYIKGDCHLKDVIISGNVYVGGNLTLGWTPQIKDDARIYYAGKFTHPPGMSQTILNKCIHDPTVPGFIMPDQGIPPTKPAEWYTSRGYTSDKTLTDGVKIFADSYSSTSGTDANNVIIIAYDGDISITGQWSTVTGVFFAPNGKVIFNGNSLEGVVIAHDGFFVTSGGTKVTFKNITNYIDDPEDLDNYPFLS